VLELQESMPLEQVQGLELEPVQAPALALEPGLVHDHHLLEDVILGLPLRRWQERMEQSHWPRGPEDLPRSGNLGSSYFYVSRFRSPFGSTKSGRRTAKMVPLLYQNSQVLPS
jgi:hypothetical protein